MKIIETANAAELGKSAGKLAAQLIRSAIEKNGQANIILATGTSQFETLSQLIKEAIDWNKVVMFHLDEYIGLPKSSPASFRRYLQERFLAKVPPLKEVYLVNGETDASAECERLSAFIKKNPIDVALVGIGENGHLGFNDPPANFETDTPFIVVDLDTACRKQQFGEGWFATIDDVPRQAISLTVPALLTPRHILVIAPEARKAAAVRAALEDAITPDCPASILRTAPHAHLYLDWDSAELLGARGQP